MNVVIKVNRVELFLFAIIFFTLLNGFFNSLAVSYGFNEYSISSFLFDSRDLHADLIKFSLSFIQHENIQNISEWPTLYQEYFYNNPYGGLESIKSGILTNMHLPPLAVNFSIACAKILKYFGPNFLLILFYCFVILSIFLLSRLLENQKKSILFFIIMMFSYPVLFILTRGHIFSFIVSILTIFFFLNIIQRKNILLPILLLAIICNFRPNALILSILFLVYGYKEGSKGLILFFFLSVSIFYLNLILAHQLYNDYTFDNFITAVGIYYELYVIGNGGLLFNNSLYGALKIVILALSKLGSFDLNTAFVYANYISLVINIILLTLSTYLYIKQKSLNIFEFIFIVATVYVLSSSIFVSYYLFFFFFFLLIPFKYPNINYSNKFLNIILFTSVFVLVPKNYFHVHSISFEVVLNPLIMTLAILYILIKSFLNNTNLNNNSVN
ncbi:MAG: hypothetical protein M0P91_09440 [Sulfuricurvum sp.]|jgi:hypothetical protein|uniref:hypothetical protein n=1 Tax=Sulfuricurvum sp. TaxID=2025608 RepID=UPI0025E4EC8E|nr:hypothetical protein [Sulfuricurvum sp.]MCK9373410.1 hypothetical protein [Sulfuricurvum sp.]